MTARQLSKRHWSWIAILVAVLTGVLWLAGPDGNGAADDKESGKTTLPADLDRVPRDAAFVVSVRVADLWKSPGSKAIREELAKGPGDVLKEIRNFTGTTPEDLERVTIVFSDVTPGPAGPPVLFFLATVKPFDKAKLLAEVAPRAKEEKRKGHTLYVADDGRAVHFINDRAYVVGKAEALRVYLDAGEPKKDGPLAGALRLAAGKHSAVFGLNAGPLGKLLEGMLPGELDPFRALLKTQIATLVADEGTEARANLHLSFTKEADAKAGAKALQTALDQGRAALEQGLRDVEKKPQGAANLIKLLGQAVAGLKAARIEQKGNDVRLAVAIKTDYPVFSAGVLEGVQRVREAATRIRSANNLKQIALAMHNYHDATGSFPPQAIYDKNGKPLLSWRVLILPYVEQQNLFKEFHLDEPWDSEHNKKLLARIPPVYVPVDGKGMKGTDTYYQAFVGKGAFFEGKKGLGIRDFTDGTSNTLMVVEAGDPVPWSKPDDLPFDPGKKLPKLGGLFANGFNAAFCDGSVRFIQKSVAEKVLRALITRNGGEVIDFNQVP
jgi:prepilin-type processing-associated H-X9-DG protein